MGPTTFQGDVVVQGNLAAQTMTIPAEAVTNAAVQAGAGIGASKLEHQHRFNYAQLNTAATAVTVEIFRCGGATATVKQIVAGSIVKAVGDSTVTIDIKKNGATILSATTVLDNANSNYVGEALTVTTAGMVAGDVLTAVITISAGTGTLPTGVYVSGTVNEDAIA